MFSSMFSSRSVWYLSVSLLMVVFLIYASSGLRQDTWLPGDIAPQRVDGLNEIISQETIDALYADARLHRAIVSLTDAVAKTSSNLGESYGSAGLVDLGRSLGEEVAKWKDAPPRKIKKRQLFPGLGKGSGGGGGGGFNLTGGLSSVLQEGIAALGGSITGSIVNGLAMPALFLGIGLGIGAETGLNLTDVDGSQAIATKVAAAFNSEATGLNLIAQNLGSGLTAQIASSLSNSTTSFSSADIGMAAFALAQGIGQGSASGLNLTQTKFQPTNDSSIMAIAGNLGLGIASPIASNLDVSKIFNGGQLTAQLPQIAAAAGKGFGQGASTGLGLQKPNTAPQRRQAGVASGQVDIPGAVGQFTQGLSQSFLQSADLKAAVGGGINFNIMGMILPIAAGAGQGIGEGAAIGLGFKADAGLSIMVSNMSSTDSTQMTAKEFSKGLVASFLANGTAKTAFANLTAGAGGLTMNIQPALVAEGLARGLVEGSVNAISMAGGIKNVLSGNFSVAMAMSMPAMAATMFVDSVNGSAVAFGRGLAGEGTLLIASMITNMTKKAPAKRSIGMNSAGVVPYSSLKRRAESTPLAVDANMLSGLAQAGSDAITCQGFGGIAAIALGLMKSGAIKLDMKNAVPLDNSTLAALPKEPISILSEGNKFQITIQDTKVTINDMNLVPFAVLTALHIVLTTFAFFFALPAYLALGAIWRISVLIGHPLTESDNKKWRKRILLILFLPSFVVGMIFGIVGMGKATHFNTVHGIFGLITFIFLTPTIVTSIQRLNTSIPIPAPTAFLGFKQIPKLFKSPERVHFISAISIQVLLQFGTISSVTGFSELRSISLCIVDAILTAPTIVGALTGILFTQIGAMSVVALRGWLEQRIAKKSLESGDEGAHNVEKGSGMKKSDTIKTFGFNAHPGNEVLISGVSPSRPSPSTRNTGQLLGREDSSIGRPTNVRKVGDDDGSFTQVDSLSDNPFVDPSERSTGPKQKGVVYNEKLGGYSTRPSSPSTPYITYRPSSDIIVADRDRDFGGESRYSENSADRRSANPPPPLPRKSSDRERAGEGNLGYKSFSRPNQQRETLGRESGEEIRVGFPVSQVGPPGGNPYGYGR